MKANVLKKLLCTFAALTICVGALLLVSCKGEEQSADTQAVTDAPTASAEGFAVYRDGVATGVVYPIAYQSEYMKTAENLAGRIKKLTGADKVNATDDYVKDGKRNPDTCEILIGLTDSDESRQAYESLSDYGECKIVAIGNKLCIASWDKEAISDAVSQLIKDIEAAQNADTKEIVLAKDYSLSVYDKGTVGIAKLPVLANTEPKIIDGGDSSIQYVFSGAKKESFDSYAKLLSQSGYTIYTDNKLEENYFATYKNDKCVVNLSYMKGLGKMFVIVDSLEKTALPALEADNVYTPAIGCDTLFTQVGLYSDDKYDDTQTTADTNGQCEVVRLADGSFIIIDGGHGEEDDAERLYNVLRKQFVGNDGEKIVIAAWIFTHAHNDHVDTFKPFADAYSEQVTVEQFIFNFPSAETAKAAEGDRRSVVEQGLAKFKDAKKIKAHVGQKFFIRNAEIEILANLELIQPFQMRADNSYNNTSLVFTVKAEGKTFMILGDCYTEESAAMVKCYTSATLKADVVQVAHHGIGGTDAALYSLIGAEYAIWPAGSKIYVGFESWSWLPAEDKNRNMLEVSWNKWIKDNISEENIYWALDDIDVFKVADGNLSVTVYENIDAYQAGTPKA